MSVGQLRQSLRRGRDGLVYERHYQMEWYRAAASYLPFHIRIAPDVGAVRWLVVFHMPSTTILLTSQTYFRYGLEF